MASIALARAHIVRTLLYQANARRARQRRQRGREGRAEYGLEGGFDPPWSRVGVVAHARSCSSRRASARCCPLSPPISTGATFSTTSSVSRKSPSRAATHVSRGPPAAHRDVQLAHHASPDAPAVALVLRQLEQPEHGQLIGCFACDDLISFAHDIREDEHPVQQLAKGCQCEEQR